MAQNDTGLGADSATARLRLLARLAAERANLLRQLRGLDEAALTTSPIGGEWTAKDILAHLGMWDAFHTERMSLVLNGRINAIKELGGQPESEDRNAEIHAFCQTLSLEQALAICLKERGGFLATLSRTPDELLLRKLTFAWGWQTQMRQWVEWRYEHDAEHAKSFAAWRKTLSREQKMQIGPFCILRALLKATRKEFIAIAKLVPTAERETRPVCGHWALKDVVGHITDWERVGVAGLRQLAAGQTPEFDPPITDFEAWNANHAAVRREQTWETVWHDFTETRRELMALVDGMADEGWKRPFAAPWNAQINGYIWTLIWADHEHEHAADVRQALNGEQ